MKTRPINPHYAKLKEMGFDLDVVTKQNQQAELHLIRHRRRFGVWVVFKGGNVRISTILQAARSIRQATHLGRALAELSDRAANYVAFGREGLLDDSKPLKHESRLKALENNDQKGLTEKNAHISAKHYNKNLAFYQSQQIKDLINNATKELLERFNAEELQNNRSKKEKT